MSIVKSKHAGNFTILPNSIFKQGLSLQSLGLLTYLLSLPHDWVIQKMNLHKQLNIGRDSLDKSFKELQNSGYILSVKEVDSNNNFKYNHIVYDIPYNGEESLKTLENTPFTDFPLTESPLTENPQLLSTKVISTKEQINYNKEKEMESFDTFWNLYDKKVGRDKAFSKYSKLTENEKSLIMIHVPKYKVSQPEKMFRKDPATYLHNKSWNDELITPPQKENNFTAPPTREQSLYPEIK